MHNEQELEYQLCQEEPQEEPQEVLLQQLQHSSLIPTLVTNQSGMNLQFWMSMQDQLLFYAGRRIGQNTFDDSIAQTFLLMLNVII
jgi:hypothetical protein